MEKNSLTHKRTFLQLYVCINDAHRCTPWKGSMDQCEKCVIEFKTTCQLIKFLVCIVYAVRITFTRIMLVFGVTEKLSVCYWTCLMMVIFSPFFRPFEVITPCGSICGVCRSNMFPPISIINIFLCWLLKMVCVQWVVHHQFPLLLPLSLTRRQYCTQSFFRSNSLVRIMA